MELIAERGFVDATVPQITARAGLTTRTFFRHHTDDREVLFAGEDELPEVVARVFALAPAGLTPIHVKSDTGPQEREAQQWATLARSATTGFIDRGLTPVQAGIPAALAVAIDDAAFTISRDDPVDIVLDTPRPVPRSLASSASRAVTRAACDQQRFCVSGRARGPDDVRRAAGTALRRPGSSRSAPPTARSRSRAPAPLPSKTGGPLSTSAAVGSPAASWCSCRGSAEGRTGIALPRPHVGRAPGGGTAARW